MTLLDQLRRTRAGFDVEVNWHRFLIDAYAGTGGFQGQVRQPAAGYWGAAAQNYGRGDGFVDNSTLTYLDRYPREDESKFARRLHVAHYLNYCAPLTDLKLSYLLSKPPIRENVPEQVEKWREDVDGRGTTWDEFWLAATYRAALCGWTPMLIDAPPADGLVTRAQAEEAGLRPKAIVLWPSALLDYSVEDGGTFAWTKIRTCHIEQPNALDAPAMVETITIWTATDASVYRIREVDGKETIEGPEVRTHGFGSVPIVIYRNKPALSDDEVLGIPMHADVSTESRRLFNLLSEFDEHLRSQVFALLQVPTSGAIKDGDLTIGTDNALPIDPNSSQKYEYIAPPASVAETYEERISATIREIYRMARVEFTRATASGGVASGIARRYEFAGTNRAIGDFASQGAKAEAWVDDVVGRFFGVSDEKREAERVTAQNDFDIGDIADDIKNTLDATTAQLGPTATRLLRSRLVARLLPNIDRETADAINEELEEQAVRDRVAAVMADEMAEAALEGGLDDDEESDGATAPKSPANASGKPPPGARGAGAKRGAARQGP